MERPVPSPTIYPPRAGALRALWSVWYAWRRRTHLRIPDISVVKPVDLTWRTFGIVLLPTYAWVGLGRRHLFGWAATLYAGCALVALVFLGLPAAGWAAGVMITLHSLGVAEYFFSGKLRPAPDHRYLRYALVFVFVAVTYTGISRRLLASIVVPVQTSQGVVLINPRTPRVSVTRDEIVAFHRGNWRVEQFMLPEGSYLGQVIGLPGDVIKFSRDRMTVNGRPLLRRRGMPGRGELNVPPNHLFIWPTNLSRDFPTEAIADKFAKAALVPDAALVGRPYRHWFLRRQ